MNSVPCIVIGGTHSGVGKTSVAIALMRAYVRRGLRVQGFKVGPDFIDPSFHRAATDRSSHNLDGWMLSQDKNLQLYARAAHDADLCIVEGVMGLFDGRSAVSDEGSTAEMAKWLGAPVILVVDGSAMARSGAALVQGLNRSIRSCALPVLSSTVFRATGISLIFAIACKHTARQLHSDIFTGSRLLLCPKDISDCILHARC